MFLCHDKVESTFWPKCKHMTKCFPLSNWTALSPLHKSARDIYTWLKTFNDLATTQLSTVLPSRKHSTSITSYCSTAFSADLESAAVLLCVRQIAVFLCDSQIALKQICLKQICKYAPLDTCPHGCHPAPLLGSNRAQGQDSRLGQDWSRAESGVRFRAAGLCCDGI